MKTFIVMLCVAASVAAAGCAGVGGNASAPSAGSGSTASTGGSGITVFGTIDAAVSGSRSR